MAHLLLDFEEGVGDLDDDESCGLGEEGEFDDAGGGGEGDVEMSARSALLFSFNIPLNIKQLVQYSKYVSATSNLKLKRDIKTRRRFVPRCRTSCRLVVHRWHISSCLLSDLFRLVSSPIFGLDLGIDVLAYALHISHRSAWPHHTGYL